MSFGAADLLHEPGPAGSEAALAARSPLALFARRLREDRVALMAAAFIVALVLAAVFAPLLAGLLAPAHPTEPSRQGLDSFGSPTGPSSTHLFGVDPNGRDVLALVLYGARVSLEVAILATALSVAIGVVAGLVAGFYRGWVDTAVSRTIDVLLAFPLLLLAIGLASACALGSGCVGRHALGRDLIVLGILLTAGLGGRLAWRVRRRGAGALERSAKLVPVAVGVAVVVVGLILRYALGADAGVIRPGLTTVIFVIVFANWTYIARIVRGQVLSLREQEFVEAARAQGASNGRIIFREILPNLVAPIIVYTTLIIPLNILLEAALSFVGVGVQPPQTSWGAMIADATGDFANSWWYMAFPGLALVLTVLAFNLLGDGLQDALNPRSRR